MPHPKIVDILLAPLTSQPRLAEAAEGVPAHAGFIKLHDFETFGEPSGFQVVVKVRRAVPGLEQQPLLAPDECSQVLCNWRAQINLSISRIRLEVRHDAGRIAVHLLSNFDG